MSQRRLDPRVAAGLAVLLVGAALLGILLFGRLAYPAFPSLRERPDPAIPGTVAWIRWDDGRSGGPCLWVARASGEQAPRRLRCDTSLQPPLRWTDEGIETGDSWAGVTVVDPATGEVVRREPGGHDNPPAPPTQATTGPDGAVAVPQSNGDGHVELWVEQDGRQRRVASVDGPRDYHWWSVVWAPGGRWAAVQDSGQRLLIVDTKGGEVRLLAEDTGEPAWGAWPGEAD